MYKELAVTTVATAAIVYTFPEYLVLERLSRTVIRFMVVNFSLLMIWRIFIYPFFFNPLRHLPGPKVKKTSPSSLPSPSSSTNNTRTIITYGEMQQLSSANRRVKPFVNGRPVSQTMASSVSALWETRIGSSALHQKHSSQWCRTTVMISRNQLE